MLTGNLANANVPGYQRRDTDFHIQLQEQMDGPQGQNRLRSRLGNHGGNARVDGNTTVLEDEMIGIAETEMRYSALTELTNRYFRGLKETIKEGR